MSHKAEHHECNSSATGEALTCTGLVTPSGPPPSEINVNQLPFVDDVCPNPDAPSIMMFDSPARGGMRMMEPHLEKIEKQIYIAPSGACSGHSSDGTFTGDPPWDTEVPSSSTPPVSTEVSDFPGLSRLHTIAFVIVTCCAQFLSLGGMNQTVAPVMILAKYFDIADYGTLSWFSAAYSLTVGTFILPAGETPAPAPHVDGPYVPIIHYRFGGSCALICMNP